MKNTNLRLVRNKILESMSDKKQVLAYEDYSELCTRKQFTTQVRYIKSMLGIETEFFNKSFYAKHQACLQSFLLSLPSRRGIYADVKASSDE